MQWSNIKSSWHSIYYQLQVLFLWLWSLLIYIASGFWYCMQLSIMHNDLKLFSDSSNSWEKSRIFLPWRILKLCHMFIHCSQHGLACLNQDPSIEHVYSFMKSTYGLSDGNIEMQEQWLTSFTCSLWSDAIWKCFLSLNKENLVH